MSTSAAEKDFRASDNPDWQPWRDAEGNVVTFTQDHCNALMRALYIYQSVVGRHGGQAFDVDEAITIMHFIRAKSCLMGRLLYEGKPPLVDAPPTVMAAPDYSLEVPRESVEEPMPFPCCDHCGCGTGGRWAKRDGHDDSCAQGCND